MSLRFFAGGGQPPQSHEVLRVEDGGEGWYLTGMPWPSQPPFDEIGVYRVELGAEGYARLVELARAALDAPEHAPGPADAGGERIDVDGGSARWSQAARGPQAQALVDAARSAITAARERPLAVARAEPNGGRVTLRNRGERALPVADGAVRAGWGPADRVPDLLGIAAASPQAVDLPAELAPGAELTVPLALPPPSAAEGDLDRPYVLVSLRWRPGVPGEREELDGWILAGPGR